MTLLFHGHFSDNIAGGQPDEKRILDASGNAHHGVAARATALTYAAGKIGGAWQQDGTSDKITLPDLAAFDFNNVNGTSDTPFTFCGWFRFLEARYQTLFCRIASSSAAQYLWRVNAAGAFGLFLYDGGTGGYNGKSTADAAVAMPSAAFVHLAVTYDGRGGDGTLNGTAASAGIVLYINGVEVSGTAATASYYTAMEDTTAVPVVGYRSDAFGYSKFIADDLRIYNEALTAAQVKAIVSPANELPYPWLAIAAKSHHYRLRRM